MDIADIVRSVVGGGGGQPPSAKNPSGYSEATPSGRDPTSGGALRDRFHQMRGDEYQMTEGTPLAQKLAVDFLTSRGAPVNPQNLAVAQEYLRGGALGAMEQQQGTEAEIADAAVAADAGGAAGGGTQPSPTQSPPPAQPVTDDPPTVIPASVDPGGIPGVGPEWMLSPLLARTAKDIGDRVANAGKPGPRTPAPAPGGAVETPIVPAREVEEAVPDTARMPAEAVVPEALPPVAARPVADAAAPDMPRMYPDVPESAPIATEEVVPTTEGKGRSVSTGSVDVGGKTVDYEVFQTPGGQYTATGPDGKSVTAKTLAEAKTAIRKAISAAF